VLKIYQEPFIQEIKEDWILNKGLQLYIKREDLIHPTVSGNKWRKLNYNLIAAREMGFDCLLTFGGAYSNHIYSTAAAAKEAGFKSIGVIRGEELADKPLNPTLQFARECGMQLHFISRSDYRKKKDAGFIEKLGADFGKFYLIPEGGTNNLAIKGAEEIVTEQAKKFEAICLAVGTGGTISGIISAAAESQNIIGFSVLKGDFLIDDVKSLLNNYQKPHLTNRQIETDYHFGGYAKVTNELEQFIEKFERQHNIPLDPIYTGKMMFGVYDLIRKDFFRKGTKILTIHTGGLQGKKGFE